jgi:two-component system sensor histidine kinase KdpD
VSHDLRTPLAAITGAAGGLLEDPPPSTSVARDLVSTVLEEAERLNRLVGNLLDMTRLESGKPQPKREWHSLEEVVGSAVGRVERYAGERRLEVHVDPDLPFVLLDAVLVEQAIVTAHGGEIRAELRAPRGARFVFTLPLAESPPAPPLDEPS